MPHLDEGRLTALLDGELDATERREAERHLAECATCRALLAELEAFAGEADQLVNAIVVPPLLPAASPGVRSTAPGAGTAPLAGRMARYRALAWAASLVLAVGLGYTASSLRERKAGALPATAALDELKEAPAEPARASPPPESRAPVRATPSAPKPTGALSTRADAPAAGVAKQAGEPQAATDLGRNEASGVAAEATAPAARSAVAQLEQRVAAPLPTAAAGRMALNSATALRPILLEEAVQALGGTIRLIDGLTPARVLLGTGELLSGADPARAAVRVVYLDPPGRELWLEQQAPALDAEADRRAAARDQALLPGDTLTVTMGEGRKRLQWMDQTGFRLGLTGQLSADSLQRLLRRVH